MTASDVETKGQVTPMRVLVIEDGASKRQVIMKALTSTGFEVNVVTEWAKARTALNAAVQKFDAVVIEESIEGGQGLTLVRELRSKRVRLPVVVVTRDGSWRSYAEVMGLGAVAYLPHPVNPTRLITAIEESVRPSREKKRKNKHISRRTRR